MPEDKKINKGEDKKDDKAPEKAAVVKIEKEKKESKESVDVPKAKSEAKEAAGVAGLEELPEDIRKKLEKKKGEAASKVKSKKKKVVRKKKKEARKVSVGCAYIKATYNNTIVTLTDTEGNVLSWASAGIAGFKGPKKSTPYAAQIITRIAVGKARENYGLQEVSVYVKGVGTGRDSAIRSLNNNGLIVTLIKDVTPMPHNGCRPKKPRRV